MRILSRPMFKYGGPIKEGVMHGMKNGGLSKQFNTGLVGDERYPKTDGREHHVGFLAPLYWGGQAALRFGPAAWRGMKAARTFTPWAKDLGKWGRIKDIFLPRKGVTGPKMKGELWKTPFVPVSAAEKAGFGVGSFARTNPITTIGLASMAPQAGALGYNVGKAGVKALPGALKRYADMVIPGDQSRWWKDKEPPTGVPLSPNIQKKVAEAEELAKKKTKEFALQQRNTRVEKYLKMMGYDRAKKTAIADALIDASKIVGDRGTLDLKNIGQDLINPIIQATSKRLDKPEQIREAVGLMATKAEIEKDLEDPSIKALRLEQLKELRGGFSKDIGDFVLSARGAKVKPKALEQFARAKADEHGLEFKVVTDEDMAGVGEGASEQEIIQSVVKGDGVYMIGDAIVQVTDGVPKQVA